MYYYINEAGLDMMSIPEGKESSYGHVDQQAAVPGGRRDLTSYVLSPTGGIKISSQILAHYSPQYRKGEPNCVCVCVCDSACVCMSGC